MLLAYLRLKFWIWFSGRENKWNWASRTFNIHRVFCVWESFNDRRTSTRHYLISRQSHDTSSHPFQINKLFLFVVLKCLQFHMAKINWAKKRITFLEDDEKKINKWNAHGTQENAERWMLVCGLISCSFHNMLTSCSDFISFRTIILKYD